MYSIVIQLGAILCLPVYFRARIAKLLSTFPQGERGDRTVLTHPLSLTVVAFVVTAMPAFLLTKRSGNIWKAWSLWERAGDRRDCDVGGGCEKREV